MLKMEVDVVMKLIQLMASRMDTSIVYYFQSRARHYFSFIAGQSLSAGLRKERSRFFLYFPGYQLYGHQ